MKIAFLAADTPSCRDAAAAMRARYQETPVENADVVVALGGDGFMLETLHRLWPQDIAIFGMRGAESLGFLCNDLRLEDLEKRLMTADRLALPFLKMRAETMDGKTHDAMAINDVSLFRQTRQTAKLEIRVDGRARLKELVADGVLVSTPAGSTAYNLSAHGPILPLSANVLALTGISPFRPRRWRGAVVPQTAQIEIHIHEPEKRPVAAVADFTEIRDVTRVSIEVAAGARPTLLFDAEHSLAERILNEQFVG